MREKSLRRVASALLTGAKSGALTILGLSVMAMAAWGQLDTGGSVSVTVTDPSGAGIPAAALSLKDTSTNVIRKAVTQQTGTYTFQSLPYGNYELTVTKDGFDNALFQDVQVET